MWEYKQGCRWLRQQLCDAECLDTFVSAANRPEDGLKIECGNLVTSIRNEPIIYITPIDEHA